MGGLALLRTGVKDILTWAAHVTHKTARGRLGFQPSSTQTLLVKSKTRSKAVLYTVFEGQRDWGHSPGEIHFHGVGDWPRHINQQSQHILYAGGE
jgi:hypothetical protein